MPYSKKRHHHGNKHERRVNRPRRKTKDLDQVDLDLKEKSDDLLNQEIDLEKPGFAQHYCIHCAKYYINQRALDDHFKSKIHKRRLKDLQNEPYTQEEAERAAGRGSFDKLPTKRKMETQPSKDEYESGKRLKIENFTPEELMTKKQRKSLNESLNAKKEMDVE